MYAPGTPPTRTRFSQTSALYLIQEFLDEAAQLAEEGMADNSTNPVHFFLAGTVYARLGRYEDADRVFDEAQRLYPAYELQIEPERRAAWARGYNQGIQAYDAEDIEGAITAWRRSALIYDIEPGAHRNLASLLEREGRYDEAIRAYEGALAGLDRLPATWVLEEEDVQERAEMRARIDESLAEILLFTGRVAEAEPFVRRQLERDPASVKLRRDLAAVLAAQGHMEEAAQMYASLLSESSMESVQLFSLGVALFRTGNYVRASEAFARLVLLRPNSRDAWFNYANALFAAKSWEALAAAGDRLLQLDPLGKSAGLIVARAHLETGDRPAALRGLERVDTAPVHVEELQMQPIETATRVQGRVFGNQVEPGTSLTLRFTFYDDMNPLGDETLLVTAPSQGESTTFEVSFGARATGFRYEVVP